MSILISIFHDLKVLGKSQQLSHKTVYSVKKSHNFEEKGQLWDPVSNLSLHLSSGRAKSAPSYKVVRWSDDEELLMTSRSTKALTSKIHQQWQPENHDLNSGVFVRGQSKAEAPPSLDTWLTFGGSAIAGETPGGIIDAFAREF